MWLFGLCFFFACSSSEPRPKSANGAESSALECSIDQVRESYCEGLVPLTTAVGAPPPYENRPAGIEAPSSGAYPARQRVARFDAKNTEATRRRVQPGHACCYSWCAALTVADPKDVLPYAGCTEPGAARENYCFPELEGGTKDPGPEPYARCPLAIRPPPTVSFSVPKAAPLDLTTTQAKRAAGEAACCYGWCSRMPAGI
ncbi:MAG: hypothetical protein QM756_26895 [Polyangiaceae bacterium]